MKLTDEHIDAKAEDWLNVSSAGHDAKLFRDFARAIESAATAPLLAEIERLKETLRFVERWANHHATKPNMTAEEALSCIQHYPDIRSITHGYADGQMPETPNPWKQLRELQSNVAALESQASNAQAETAVQQAAAIQQAKEDGR